MTSITHQEAQRLIQAPSLDTDQAACLSRHLQSCSDCSSFARTNDFLRNKLAVSPARLHPTPATRQAVLAEALGRRSQPSLSSLAGSLAFLVILAVMGASALYAFMVMGPESQPAGSEQLAQRLASPLQTMIAIIAPPAMDTPEPSPTPRPVPESPTGRIIIDVPSPSLANNIIGEPAYQPAAVILPPSYASSDRRYPVVYFFASGDQVPDRTDDDDLIELIMNKLSSQGLVQEMIVVMPSVRTALGMEAIIANSPVTGNWEDYVSEDLVSYIDQNFRTLPQAASRGLAGGAQVGGLNVLNLALRHPELFSVVHAQQPWLMAPDSVAEDRTLQPPIRLRASRTIEELADMSRKEAADRYVESLTAVSAQSMLRRAFAYGMAMAPDAGRNAPYFDYPYLEGDTPADEAVWQRWESGAGDWDAKIAAYLAQPSRLNAIGLARDRDWVFMVENDAIDHLAQALSEADLPVELHRFDRYDSAKVVQLEGEVLPFLSQNLASE